MDHKRYKKHGADCYMIIRTFVYAVKSGEDNYKECRGIFPGIHEMWKCQSRVPITTQALCKTKPRWQRRDHGTYAVRHTTTDSWTYNDT